LKNGVVIYERAVAAFADRGDCAASKLEDRNAPVLGDIRRDPADSELRNVVIPVGAGLLIGSVEPRDSELEFINLVRAEDQRMTDQSLPSDHIVGVAQTRRG